MKRAQSTSEPPAKCMKLLQSGGFSMKNIPPHHFHLGENKFACVSDFAGVTKVHLRKYADNEGILTPTKEGITLTPFAWQSLSEQLLKDPCFTPTRPKEQRIIVSDELLVSTRWVDNPDVSEDRSQHVCVIVLQPILRRKDLSFQFIPKTCILSPDQWDILQSVRQSITASTISTLLGTPLRRSLLVEVAITPPLPADAVNVDRADGELLLTTSMIVLFKTFLAEKLGEVFVCNGCENEYANQLGHDCLNLRHEDRVFQYGDLAVCKLNLKDFAAQFVRDNSSNVNCLTATFLDSLNMQNMLTAAKDLYIAEDERPTYSL